jgi:hypothetical protein
VGANAAVDPDAILLKPVREAEIADAIAVAASKVELAPRQRRSPIMRA